MRFYMVHRSTVGQGSAGYEFFVRKHDAEKAVREWNNDGMEPGEEMANATVTVVDIKPTKVGILAALNHYASHADNG